MIEEHNKVGLFTLLSISGTMMTFGLVVKYGLFPWGWVLFLAYLALVLAVACRYKADS